jgi:hypothetical protein
VGNFSRLSNLSIRTTVAAAPDLLFVGLTVGPAGSSATKALLARAIGPTLGIFGLTGVNADPKLDMIALSNNATVATNDNWETPLAGGSSAATITAVATSVGAFGVAAGSKDAVVFTPATPAGGYTAQISSVGAASGIVLAELYDSQSGLFTATTARLTNVSARTTVGTGGNILIAGFNIAGDTAKTVLIRGVGPTLGVFGVPGTLADPQLELQTATATPVTVFTNDDWGGGAAVTAAATSVGAFPLGATSKDSVMLITLPPGGYTASIKGAANTTGVALVEVYEVP